MVTKQKTIRIAQISDLHMGSQFFIPNLLSRAIEELNDLNPDAVVVTGDLTDEGFKQEYKTAETFLGTLECKHQLYVPGNHDSRNVGYLHFEELFGERNRVLNLQNLTLVGTDSSEPDLDSGRIGRERYRWLNEEFGSDDNFKILALHHHLLPIPGTGRERNIVFDAGDLLEILLRIGVDLVLCGHKHVPYVWRLENVVVVNAGTTSTLRLRGKTKPCYNVIDINEEKVLVYRKYPYGKKELIADFSPGARKYCKWNHFGDEIGPGGEVQ